LIRESSNVPHRLTATAFALFLLAFAAGGSLLCQERQRQPPTETAPQRQPPAEDPDDSEETDDAQSDAGDQGPAPEEAAPEEITDDQADSEDAEGDDSEEIEVAPLLTPEEQAKLDELRRKREEKEAKREALRAEEEAKELEQAAKEEAKLQEKLAKVLEIAYFNLEGEKYAKARQGFNNHKALKGGKSFQAEMGLARVELALGNPAQAIEHALKAEKATWSDPEESEALTFSGDAMLAARPIDEATGKPLPGGELYESNALRFYIRAIAADPEGAQKARRELARAFPAPTDKQTARLYSRYLEVHPKGPRLFGLRLAATYEALMSGMVDGRLIAVAGVTPPRKLSGKRPAYPQTGNDARRRLFTELEIEPDGTVSKATLLNDGSSRFDGDALAVFEGWRFEPARLPSGEPVPVHYVVLVNALERPLETPGEGAGESPSESPSEPSDGRPNQRPDRRPDESADGRQPMPRTPPGR
jgi:hypothetical protein